MKKFLYFILLITIAVSFTRCETDFNIIADYKEIAVVYGLLNQNEDVHYLRINKAFLGEGNALTYAKIADSSSYGSNIDIVLTETTPSGSKKDIVFDTVTLYNKQDGVFYAPGQLFYKANAKLNQANTYSLSVTDKKTGYNVSSETKLINDFGFTIPSAGSKSISFKRAITQTKSFEWENAKNGKRYQLTVHFFYKESRGFGDTTMKIIDWDFPSVSSPRTDGTGKSEVAYLNESFFTLCLNRIPYSDPAVEGAVLLRIADNIDLEMTVIDEDFSTYLDVNGPSTGVSMDKPQYTNITNGLGLFSSRYQIHRIIALNAETRLDLSRTTLKFQPPQ